MNTILFEYPCSDASRICLRLEKLFQHIDAHIERESIHDSHTTMCSILNVLSVIDRPDLKSKLTQVLTQLNCNLSPLIHYPNIEKDKLTQTINEINTAIDTLHYLQGRFGDQLRANPFLSHILSHIHQPGGLCDFNTPSYRLWLLQDSSLRIEALQSWYKQFYRLKNVTQTILHILRGCATHTSATFVEGIYQQGLKSNGNYHMVSIEIPKKMRIYPEISIGKHRLCVRLLHPKFSQQPEDYTTFPACTLNVSLYKT